MIEQLGIAFTGAAAVWLSQDKSEKRRKWACVFGLLGQPFWIYAAYSVQAWGILAVTVLYTLAWIRGFKTHWMK